jgi:hydrogenase maturation protease
VVLGLGNPLRADDGAGPAVIAELARRSATAAGARLVDLGGGDLLAELMEPGARRVILVDAAEMGRAPGEWRRFPVEEGQPAATCLRSRLSTHSGGLEQALALRAALGLPPAEVIVYGIQPGDTGYAWALSPEVATATRQVAAAIAQEIAQRRENQGDNGVLLAQ